MSLLANVAPGVLDPSVQTVLLCGCGGGFDFVHGLTLYPELVRLGKRVVIGSYSFGLAQEIGGDAPVVFDSGGALAKRVTAASVPDAHYGPEVHLCSYLDAHYPAQAPHSAYAYYARSFTVPLLSELYRQLVRDHNVDAIIVVDGGSDSLMRGDEHGLGDPIEDAVSVAAVASLDVRVKALLSVGFGADRFNNVSDAASLRAVAELAAAGGFRGAVSLVPDAEGFRFYRAGIEHIYGRQTFRSALSGFIVAAGEGNFGNDEVHPLLASRVRGDGFFVWPLMAMLWGFDVDAVAARSLVVPWIRDCETVLECYAALERGRRLLPGGVRDVEDLPRHAEMVLGGRGRTR
jgi:hypothetical protein